MCRALEISAEKGVQEERAPIAGFYFVFIFFLRIDTMHYYICIDNNRRGVLSVVDGKKESQMKNNLII